MGQHDSKTKGQQRQGFPGIEPHTMAVPQMDRPSVMFAMMLDAMVIDEDYNNESGTALVCTVCTEAVCLIEVGDSMRVLLNTALAHRCWD